MGVDGIGRGGARPVVSTDASQNARPVVSPRPQTNANPVGDFFKDSFDKAKSTGGVIGGVIGSVLGGPVGGIIGGQVGGAISDAIQASKDAAKLKETKDVLKNSPTGAAAVKYMEDHNIPVEFADGGGSYWDGNKIVIDRSQDPQEAALTLVHEINHAKATIDGPRADVQNQTRDDYVNTLLNEETRGTVDSIRAKNELVAAGDNVTATFPLEAEYNAASKKAIDEAKAKDPSLTEAQLREIGDKAGYDAVLNGFKTGAVVTSTNGQNYPDYYGQGWDAAHPSR
ncbi:hypothetical protein JYK02_03820 [Corallococcus macrosporus]|uniref:Glycine zipper domain-containing protein n=1 Tax=Corallococcus macrosporus TaxID=35 RepID=A0ABS3D6S4_9BACT|nr:hypothetical protein [Corallococcus macrosporus]MBN8226632.1 hypothetical protein [Corallococcus macrosporus]